MKVFNFILALLLVIGFAVSFATAQETEKDFRETSLTTEAGLLEILRRKDIDFGYEVRLDGRIVLKTSVDENIDAIPIIHTYYKRGLNDGKEIVLLEFVSGGNACPGGGLRFLTLGRDELPKLSEYVDACTPPIVSWHPNKVVLFFPRHRVLRGEGFIPEETWVFENGQLNDSALEVQRF
jgi:hypothetical protein